MTLTRQPRIALILFGLLFLGLACRFFAPPAPFRLQLQRSGWMNSFSAKRSQDCQITGSASNNRDQQVLYL